MTNFVTAPNNASTTLGSALSSSGTSITLASATNFPSSIPTGFVLPVTLNDAATRSIFEVCYITAISGTTLTVTRAQEGTTAQNWAIGDYAYCAWTYGFMQSVSPRPYFGATATGTIGTTVAAISMSGLADPTGAWNSTTQEFVPLTAGVYQVITLLGAGLTSGETVTIDIVFSGTVENSATATLGAATGNAFAPVMSTLTMNGTTDSIQFQGSSSASGVSAVGTVFIQRVG